MVDVLSRRTLLTAAAGLAPLGVLASCADSGAATTPLLMAQVYAADLANAMAAAAPIYLAGPPAPSAANAALVNRILADMQTAKDALDGVTIDSAAHGVVAQIIAIANQLAPFLTPFMGAAGPYVPLAIAVLTTFLQTLPPPAGAGDRPPKPLQALAAKYRAHPAPK